MLRYTPATSISGSTFTRASTATDRDSAGLVRDNAINVLRSDHYVLNPVTGLYERSTLLELGSTNICLRSEDFTVLWATLNSPVPTGITESTSGVTLSLLQEDSTTTVEGYQQVIAFTGDGVKAISVFMKRGTIPAPSGNTIHIRDAITGYKLDATITWDGSGVPSVSMFIGTHIGTIAYTNGVYRFLFQTTSVVAANTNELRIWTSKFEAVAATWAAETGNVYAGGVQAENNPFPTSYKGTAAAIAPRSPDVFSLPFSIVPEESTFYVKFIEGGTASISGARVMQISSDSGASGNGPRLVIYAPAGFYGLYHQNTNGGGSVTSILASGPSIGQLVELRGVLGADGKVTMGQSINGGAEVVAATSAAHALAAAWSEGRMWLNRGAGLAIGDGSLNLLDLKVAKGTKTLAQMRVA